MKARMQFSLRVAILGVTLFAAILGIWAQRANRQRQIVADITALGGSVAYDLGALYFLEPVLGIDFVADVSVVNLYRIDNAIDPVSVDSVNNIDAIIPLLQQLPRLQRVTGMFKHGGDASRLQRALPSVEIKIGIGGVI